MDIAENRPFRADIETIRRQIDRMAAITRRPMSIEYYRTQDHDGGRRIVDIYKSSDQEE
jgi:hypothetical protein